MLHTDFRPNKTVRWHACALLLLLSAWVAPSAFADTDHMDRDRDYRGHAAGPVLPATARPFGISLTDAASLTGVFNQTDHSGPVPAIAPRIQMLYTTATNAFTVGRGDVLYVPLVWNNNVPEIIGDFPTNPRSRRQLLNYWFSQSQFGVTAMEFRVDGRLTTLGGGNLVQVELPPTADTSPLYYQTAAAYIAGLRPGEHTIALHFRATGDALRRTNVAQYFPDGVFEF